MRCRMPMAQKNAVAPAAMVAALASSFAGSYQMMDVAPPATKATQMRVFRSMHVKVIKPMEYASAL